MVVQALHQWMQLSMKLCVCFELLVLLLLLLGDLFVLLSFSAPLLLFHTHAGPSRLFSYVVVTVRLMKNDSFDYDGGLHCAYNSYGLGSNWDYSHVLVN
jgi:hypothetical protein